MTTVLRTNDHGEAEKRCSKCRSWWPATREFFSTASKAAGGGLHSWCLCCSAESKQIRLGRLDPERAYIPSELIDLRALELSA